MLASYLDAAMERAHYEIIEDEGSFWGEIPGVQGVWARHATWKDVDASCVKH